VRPTLKTRTPVIERTQEIRKKFTLGRNKNKNKVTVFLKNNKTRRKINDEITSVQQKPINEIKEYLRKQNLIKAGSEAPSDILRKLYKDSLLAGEIKNKNTNTLMHNYLSEDEN
jgi:tRNA uridine 5-carbamoylmethylation protein Kti12